MDRNGFLIEMNTSTEKCFEKYILGTLDKYSLRQFTAYVTGDAAFQKSNSYKIIFKEVYFY